MTSVLDIPALVTLFSAGVPPVGSIVVNVSSEVPVVTMRILNEDNMDAVVTQLGQKLTLRIEIHPVNGEYFLCSICMGCSYGLSFITEFSIQTGTFLKNVKV